MGNEPQTAPGSDGGLIFDAFGERLTPRMPAAAFSALKLAQAGVMHMARDYTYCEFRSQLIGGQRFHGRAHFEGSKLMRVELTAAQADDGTSWADWSMEKELRRKALHERWAAAYFGKPLTLRPLYLPEPVLPANPTERDTTHALFTWGEVMSYYDDRSAGAGITIKYQISV